MLDGKKVNISTGGNFNPISDGAYICQISDVSLINGFNSFKGADEDKLNYLFIVLDDNKQEDGTSSRGRYLFKRCSLSLNEKSWLYKVYKAVIGHSPSKEELEGFDPEKLVGTQVKCLVEQKPGKNDIIWNNIISFSKADKVLDPVEYTPKPSVIEKTTTGVSESVDDLDIDKEIEKLEEEEKKTK
jgi:hypothetical protein